MFEMSPHWCNPVSYTHLDVYKRQVRTLVVVLIRPWFGPITSSTILSVVVFIFIVFEEFGHFLDGFYLAARPRPNYFFIIMI